jgi:molybdopterin converting factor small subunit
MYGLPYEITTLREVEVDLEEGADMSAVIRAMRDKVPALSGPVFRPGADRLQGQYKFNVNGRFYFEGMDFSLGPNDSISLLVPVTGG